MIRQKKSTFRKVLVSLLSLTALILPIGLTTTKSQAAAKPAITSKMEIGIGSIEGGSGMTYAKGDLYTIEVSNPTKNATYRFTSSDNDIVTVKTKGTKAYLTGVKAGTTKITCQQKSSGRTTIIGTCKVTVNNATVHVESYDGLSLGTNKTVLVSYGYRNINATYTFTSDSKDFTVKEYSEKQKGSKNFYCVGQSYTAKKTGTYTVTVKETYNKKTRVVGKAEFKVYKATVSEEDTAYEKDSIGAYRLINHCRSDVNYFFDIEDDNILELQKTNDGGLLINAKKAGTTTVKIYEDATNADESKLIGTCKITVEKLKVENIDTDFDDTETYVGGDNIGFNVCKVPENAPDIITVSSSDPKIARVSEIDKKGYGEIIPVSEGKVKITITCGKFTKTETITIYADEDAE